VERTSTEKEKRAGRENMIVMRNQEEGKT